MTRSRRSSNHSRRLIDAGSNSTSSEVNGVPQAGSSSAVRATNLGKTTAFQNSRSRGSPATSRCRAWSRARRRTPRGGCSLHSRSPGAPGGTEGPHTDLQARTDRIIPWVFHRRGNPIKSFYGARATACAAAGVPGRILPRPPPHRCPQPGAGRRLAARPLCPPWPQSRAHWPPPTSLSCRGHRRSS